MKIFIALPYRDMVSARAAHAQTAAILTAAVQLRQPEDSPEFIFRGSFRSHVHIARDTMAREAMEANADFIWWMDDDAVPPAGIFMRLYQNLSTKHQISLPWFCTRNEAASVSWTIREEVKDGLVHLVKDRRIEASDPPQEVHMSGFHCVLMSSHALRAAYDAAKGKPFRYQVNSAGEVLSEDTSFFQFAYIAGYRAWLDTTIDVGHVGEKVYGRAESLLAEKA